MSDPTLTALLLAAYAAGAFITGVIAYLHLPLGAREDAFHLVVATAWPFLLIAAAVWLLIVWPFSAAVEATGRLIERARA